MLRHVRLFATPWTIQAMEFSRPEYWSGSCSLLHGIFPTQGSNPGLPHCMWILSQLRHQGSPRILKWVTYPFSSGSSQPRNQTRVLCTAGDLGSIPGLGRSPGEGKGYPLFWPGELHGLYSPWGHKELDTTEQLSLSLFKAHFAIDFPS